MQLNIIAAMANNRVIGNANSIPWHLPEDLHNFRRLTFGHPVIMGRKTWQSLPEKFRPLPGRLNVVLSRDDNFRAAGALTAVNFNHALAEIAQNYKQQVLTASSQTNENHQLLEIFVIGGENIYQQALPLARNIFLTTIDITVAGDSYFPDIATGEWHIIRSQPHISSTGVNYTFHHYQRLDK